MKASASSFAVPGTDIVLHHYRLPSVNGEGWAIITIGTDGTFTALSDYGNYGYAGWRHHGKKDIREFFVRGDRTSDSYLVGKLTLGQRDKYDGEATVRHIRERIIERRFSGARRQSKKYTAEWARREWDLTERCGVEHDGEVGFTRWYDQTTIDDAYELCRTMKDPACVAFVEKVLLGERFQTLLRQHLGIEAKEIA